jgi:uncharacterized protein (DUF302 family)
MNDLPYALVVDSPLDHDAAVARTTELLGGQGFGVLTSIDMKATLKKKLDVDVEAHTILGACNPPFALQAITAEEGIGVLLPCNVVVRAKADGGSRIFLTRVDAMLGLVGRDEIAPIADEVGRRLEAVRAALAG